MHRRSMNRMRNRNRLRYTRAYQDLYGLEDAITAEAAAAAVTDCTNTDVKGPPGPFSLLSRIGELCGNFLTNCGGGGWGGASNADMVKCGGVMVPRGRRTTEEEWAEPRSRERGSITPRKTVTFRSRVQCKLIEVKEERFAVVPGGKDSLYFQSEETQSIRVQLSSPGKERDEWLDLLAEVRENTVTQPDPSS